MKKYISIALALIMAFTVFIIPGHSVVFADEDDNVQAMDVESYTVHFKTNGGGDDFDQLVTKDSDGKFFVAKPDNPTKPEDANYTYTFDAWCTDEGLEKPFDFSQELTGDNPEITLYARWTQTEKAPQVGSIALASRSCNSNSITLSWKVTGNINKVVVKCSNGKTYTPSGTSVTISGLKGVTKYTYTIESYYGEQKGNTISGSIYTDGPFMSNGYEYYYRNGSLVKNGYESFTDTRFGTNKYKLWHYYDASGKFVGRKPAMYNKIKNMKSKKYLICIDRTNNVLCVYVGGKGKWRPYKYWSCVTGRTTKGDYHPTPAGTFKVKSKKLTFSGFAEPKAKKNKHPYSVWYCTRFTGSVFIHSQLYKKGSKTVYVGKGGKVMGVNASHGCVRLFKDYSYWVYKNCAKGTTIVVIN